MSKTSANPFLFKHILTHTILLSTWCSAHAECLRSSEQDRQEGEQGFVCFQCQAGKHLKPSAQVTEHYAAAVRLQPQFAQDQGRIEDLLRVIEALPSYTRLNDWIGSHQCMLQAVAETKAKAKSIPSIQAFCNSIMTRLLHCLDPVQSRSILAIPGTQEWIDMCDFFTDVINVLPTKHSNRWTSTVSQARQRKHPAHGIIQFVKKCIQVSHRRGGPNWDCIPSAHVLRINPKDHAALLNVLQGYATPKEGRGHLARLSGDYDTLGELLEALETKEVIFCCVCGSEPDTHVECGEYVICNECFYEIPCYICGVAGNDTFACDRCTWRGCHKECLGLRTVPKTWYCWVCEAIKPPARNSDIPCPVTVVQSYQDFRQAFVKP